MRTYIVRFAFVSRLGVHVHQDSMMVDMMQLCSFIVTLFFFNLLEVLKDWERKSALQRKTDNPITCFHRCPFRFLLHLVVPVP